MPTPLSVKNEVLLSCHNDLRIAYDLCLKAAELLKHEIDRQEGKPTKSTRPQPVARRATVSAGDAEGKRKTAPRPTARRATLGGAGKALLKEGVAKPSSKIKVVVRKRPAREGESDIVECVGAADGNGHGTVRLMEYIEAKNGKDAKWEPRDFILDDAFNEKDTTSVVYERAEAELIENFFDGGSSTCFCFGQTASGKTFTLFGAGGGLEERDGEGYEDRSHDNRAETGGIYMLAAEDMMVRLHGAPELSLQVSMFEVYGEDVRDLLGGGAKLAALEDAFGVLQLVNLTVEEVADMEDFVRLSNRGRSERATHETDANATSSRSHAAMVFRLVNRESGKSCGKFSLIDLAGAERGADHETANEQTKREGKQINQSILALKQVFTSMNLGRDHKNFRGDKLTQVLQDSLSGKNCMTTLIGCVSPRAEDFSATKDTLRNMDEVMPKARRKSFAAGSLASKTAVAKALQKQRSLEAAAADADAKAEAEAAAKARAAREAAEARAAAAAAREAEAEARRRAAAAARVDDEEGSVAAAADDDDDDDDEKDESEGMVLKLSAGGAQPASRPRMVERDGARRALLVSEQRRRRREEAEAAEEAREARAEADRLREEEARRLEAAGRASARKALAIEALEGAAREKHEREKAERVSSLLHRFAARIKKQDPGDAGGGSGGGHVPLSPVSRLMAVVREAQHRNDPLHEALSEFNLQSFYEDVKAEAGSSSLEDLDLLGYDGLAAIGVPRVEAKKLLKRVAAKLEAAAAAEQAERRVCPEDEEDEEDDGDDSGPASPLSTLKRYNHHHHNHTKGF